MWKISVCAMLQWKLKKIIPPFRHGVHIYNQQNFEFVAFLKQSFHFPKDTKEWFKPSVILIQGSSSPYLNHTDFLTLLWFKKLQSAFISFADFLVSKAHHITQAFTQDFEWRGSLWEKVELNWPGVRGPLGCLGRCCPPEAPRFELK